MNKGYKKGYKFERDLKQHLEKDGWMVIRSGGSKKPDLIAARGGKIIILECKVTAKDRVYVDKNEVDNLKKIASAFNADGVYAIKQKQKGWSLISLSDLKQLGKSYFVQLN